MALLVVSQNKGVSCWSKALQPGSTGQRSSLSDQQMRTHHQILHALLHLEAWLASGPSRNCFQIGQHTVRTLYDSRPGQIAQRPRPRFSRKTRRQVCMKPCLTFQFHHRQHRQDMFAERAKYPNMPRTITGLQMRPVSPIFASESRPIVPGTLGSPRQQGQTLSNLKGPTSIRYPHTRGHLKVRWLQEAPSATSRHTTQATIAGHRYCSTRVRKCFETG